MKLEPVSLKKHPTLNEKWVQDLIADDPSLLGLGDLVLRDKERIQGGAGRLDLLLQDPDTLKRFEVEIQLGASDESHIIRTIEYWDIERKRYPQYEHTAVIVAEDITSRFLNVIQLFNGAIPLIALKMTAYKVGDQTYLTFVKVIDEISYGLVNEDEPVAEPTDRPYWEKKSSKSSLALVDRLLEIVRQVEPSAELKYNKHYIGLTVSGSALNFIIFEGAKNFVRMKFRLPKQNEYDALIQESGLELLTYDAQFKFYRVRIESNISVKQKETILELAKIARERFGKRAD